METVEDVIVLFLLTLLQLVKSSDNLIFCLYILPCQILHILCCRFEGVEILHTIGKVENIAFREVIAPTSLVT